MVDVNYTNCGKFHNQSPINGHTIETAYVGNTNKFVFLYFHPIGEWYNKNELI